MPRTCYITLQGLAEEIGSTLNDRDVANQETDDQDPATFTDINEAEVRCHKTS